MTKAKPVDKELEEKLSQKIDEDFEGNDVYGTGTNVQSDPLIDPGEGKPVILRTFTFKTNPKLPRLPPTKQELFNVHATQIKTLLWADGLTVYEGSNPRLTIDRKSGTYKIIVAAQPRLGVTVIETPRTLNELIKPNAVPKH